MWAVHFTTLQMWKLKRLGITELGRHDNVQVTNYAFDYAKNIYIDDILKEHVGGLYHMRHIEIRVFICRIMGEGYLPDLSPEEEDIFRIYK